MEKIAGLINPAKKNLQIFRLSRLQRGEFIAKGAFELDNGNVTNGPVQLSTYLLKPKEGL
ncbi:MAG: hypothetical protein IJ733_06565 [Lachnospiraceae bacterium]|nr:hypothetical protein [Lachnospiraceae bacterium]